MSLIEALNWRYATKKMNGQKVPQEKVDQILEAARLAPTSSGLQPFKIIVVTNPELKEKISAVAYGQTQIVDSSHLLVFAAWDNYTVENIKAAFIHANAQRNLPAETTKDYEERLIGMYTGRTPEENFNHAARQAYIGFGVAIAEAALLKVDATPMEGFDPQKLDELLDLKSKNLRSTTLLPLGYRDHEGDWLVNLKKVRTPLEDFIIEVK
ncbi:NAD(P)H-dependent oxidoreductase [Pedobacter nutrimenti]|uniref:Nitroreductase n=1 Tax=Pedobacter nutrimenti TaxID=1241337 RepID=A0A318U8D8_9SPHI|nr:NAD(P)H-dependent oxidoreductase [Pedobacter nutrimenti]PYF70723.1 nitroreductase [Pedobacter nutrimenti]